MTARRGEPQAPPDGAVFRAAMRQFVGTISVVTAGLGDNRAGLVATSAVAQSADPPTMLVCINRSAGLLPLLDTYRHFGVNFLHSGQQALAERFSGKTGLKGNDRFDDAEWVTKATGAPLLDGAAAAFDCAITDMIERGTHVIVLGTVKAILTAPAEDALVYWHGAYHRLAGKTL